LGIWISLFQVTEDADENSFAGYKLLIADLIEYDLQSMDLVWVVEYLSEVDFSFNRSEF
jgi:hypothetical protein